MPNAVSYTIHKLEDAVGVPLFERQGKQLQPTEAGIYFLKRSEMVQLLAQQPDLVMLDEPDSGVDLENIKLIGDAINQLTQKDQRPSYRTKSGIIITHFGHILDYMKADRAHVMLGGAIVCSGNPGEILEQIKKSGYEGCAGCACQA